MSAKTANTELKEMGNLLAAANSVLLFPHINPDGDALGACAALCRVLRGLGKQAWILTEREVPHYLQFLLEDEVPLSTTDRQIMPQPDISFCVDCSEEKRFPGRAEAFAAGKISLCADHHHEISCEMDYYYIDSDAAAASEIVWDMITQMGWPMDVKTAEALYTGISSDTGNFQYSNTTPKTHRIAASLMEAGVDINPISVNLFQSYDPLSMAVRVKALQSMELVAGGKAAMAKLSAADLHSVGAPFEQRETVIDDLRDIDGVEIAAFVKEDTDRIRVSLRAKTDGNVAVIAQKYGGGGHIKSAGCSMFDKTLDEVYEIIREELIRVFS